MSHIAPPGQGPLWEAAANIRALHAYIRNARYREEQTGELPPSWDVSYFLQLARFKPPPAYAADHPRLMAHLDRWAAAAGRAPPAPDRPPQTPAS